MTQFHAKEMKTIPVSRYNQLRRVAYLCAEGWDASDAELVKVVCGELNVSAKVAGALIKEYRTLFCVRQLGDDVFSVSCGGDPAVAYDRHMRRTLLMQRMEVLTPRELNLVRSYLGIGQPDERPFRSWRSTSTTTAPAERRRRTSPRCGS